jgi:poly(beta-D-mannuronate) lyase
MPMLGLKFLWPLLILFSGVSSSVAADSLHSPWDAPITSTETAYTCPAVTHLSQDLNLDNYYSDERHSIVDAARKKAYDEGSAPYTNFSHAVVKAADAYRTSGSQRAAECAITLLDAAAKDKALTGAMKTAQAVYVQGWSLSSWAIAYLKVRSSGAASLEDNLEIAAWLKKLAEENRDYYEHKSRNPHSDAHDNHLYWAGLAISAAGIAAEDRKLFNWGMNAYREGARDITADGTLPIEMERGGRALHYHLYALAPLVMLAELGESNGVDLYSEKHHAIQRLVDRCAAGLQDPSYFVQHTGVPQDMPADLDAWEIGWAKPYIRRFPNANLSALLSKVPNLSYTTWGGDPPE